MNLIISSVIILGILGLLSAVILYFVAQKFKVEEDSRIDEVESVLPGANCGGCGYPGCHGFAQACVKADSLEGMLCPVGGMPTMAKVSAILGQTVTESAPKVAVVRCNGTCENRPKKNEFDGAKSCRIATQLYSGESGCSYGCLGFGDCVDACKFDAIRINPDTGIAEVDEDKCTACGACAKACPKNIIEIRPKGPKGRRVYVSCVNKDKGGVARKACSAACIGCGKCAKVCPFGAITIENNLSYIDFTKCKSCRKCVAECPTGAIHAINFPTPAPAAVKPAPKPAASTLKVDAPQAVSQSAVKPAEKTAEKPIQPVTEPKLVTKVETKVEEVKQTATVEKKEEKKVLETKIEKTEEKKAAAEQPKAMVIPENVSGTDLIDPALRVTPREKKETKNDKKASDDKMQSLNF